jgi:hypothetical protein
VIVDLERPKVVFFVWVIGMAKIVIDGNCLHDPRASLNANVTITYTGLTIKGGSGNDGIENDAKNGIVTDGNGNDSVVLGGAGAKATLGTGTDRVTVGESFIGTNETAGSALGDKVTFGNAATAKLVVGIGVEAGSTTGTTSIGLTKVVKAADGMVIDFTGVTTSHGPERTRCAA